ncbi:hypothetical protein ABT112_06670 [Streptomyces sp. NPDC002055]|uniref:hypothetical protein n=1 Tax=Streptomyces sp. NPDC002055 TaxID=3154534 RepID=UPI00332A1DA0
MRKIRTATVLATAFATVLLFPGTSNAGTNSGWVYTTDWDPGGAGAFGHDGDVIKACDDQADGYDVIIHLFRMSNYKDLATVKTNGGHQDCETRGFARKVPENIRVGIRVSLAKNGHEKFHGRKFNLIS